VRKEKGREGKGLGIFLGKDSNNGNSNLSLNPRNQK
jgi:hypothetical protein